MPRIWEEYSKNTAQKHMQGHRQGAIQMNNTKATKLVYVTTPSETEAVDIGRALVEQHLVACANIINGMKSIYRWGGKIEEGIETILILKTVGENVDKVSQKIKSLHSDDCPCVVVLDINGGNEDFLNWIVDETN